MRVLLINDFQYIKSDCSHDSAEDASETLEFILITVVFDDPKDLIKPFICCNNAVVYGLGDFVFHNDLQIWDAPTYGDYRASIATPSQFAKLSSNPSTLLFVGSFSLFRSVRFNSRKRLVRLLDTIDLCNVVKR